MKKKNPAIIIISIVTFALTIHSQDAKKDSDQIKAAPSRIPGHTNLQEAVNKLVTKWTEPNAGNRDPSDLDPKAKSLRDLGMELFYKKNLPDEGIKKIEEALKIDPRMPDAYNVLTAYYALGKKDPQTAARYLEQGVQHCPNSSSVRFDLGNVYSQLGQPLKAIEKFQAALELGFEYKGAVFYNIGNAYMQLDQKTDAITYYRKALSEDEKHLAARRKLVTAYALSGQTEAAREQAKRLRELDPDGKEGAWAQEALRNLESP